VSTVKETQAQTEQSISHSGVPAARWGGAPAKLGRAEAGQPRLRRLRAAVSTRFRLPTEDDDAPASRRLLGMSLWAATCVFAGIIPAGRLVTEYFFGDAGRWYLTTGLSIGLIGAALIAAAFAAIHRAYLPWYLLGVASLLLVTNIALMAVA
jgi:hypothetical protein